MEKGTLSLSGDSKIEDCNATDFGGAIYNKSENVPSNGNTISLLNSTIDGHNTAAFTAVNAKSGGGIYMEKGTLSLSGSRVEDCNATNYGGAIYNASEYIPSNGNTISLLNSIIDGHASLAADTPNAESGGGIFMQNGTLNLRGDTEDTAAITDCHVSVYGGAVYQNSSGNSDVCGFTMESGSISGNEAELGGAVYVVNDKAFAMSGGTISSNSATGTTAVDGGAINVGGAKARLYFSGSPVVYNNLNATAGLQKNVVLSEDSNEVINTNKGGLTGGTIGVYVIEGTNGEIYKDHGMQDKPFGTYIEETGTSRGNHADVFVNDRNRALYGVKKDDDLYYWLPIVCKLTDGNNNLLYRNRQINGQNVKVAAVYPKLEGDDVDTCGLAAAQGTLYPYDSTTAYAGNAVQVKMLCDYEPPAGANVTGSRAVTLTTAETTVNSNMTDHGDSYIFAKSFTHAQGRLSTDSETTAIIRRKADLKNASMFATGNTANFTVKDIILDGGSVQTAVNGGIINANAGSLKIQAGAVLRNSKTIENGGAVYVANGATAEMTGGELTGNEAVNGGAVYVLKGGIVTLKDGTKTVSGTATPTSVTIAGNTVRTNAEGAATARVDVNKGAGIYLAEGAKLNMEGSPSFVKGDAVNSLTDTSYPGDPAKTNGQQQVYTSGKVRQDIYLDGYVNTNATSIVVTGAIGSGDGSIWVWANQKKHYEMLEQFATFKGDLVKSNGQGGQYVDLVPDAEKVGKGADEIKKLNEEKLTDTYEAFRNAQDDATTGCGGDYLTGQEGDSINLIKWTGGFDFVFKKIDGEGNALDGAEFTLYMSTKDSGGNYVPATNATSGAMIAYQQTDKVNGGKKNATATSGKGTQTDPLAGTNEEHAVVIKVNTGTEDNPVLAVPDPKVYGKGLAVFEKIPPGVYFIKETTDANGIATIGGKKYKPVEEMHMVDINGKGFYTFYVATLADDGTTTWVKDDAHKAPMETLSVGSDTVDVPVALNVSAGSRKVVLRKVENSTTNPYGSIKSAVFDVYYADKQTVVKLKHTTTTVVNGVSTTTTTVEALQDLASKNSGAFWMGELPCGTYYIEETDSAGYKMPTHFFVLEVTDSGVMTKEISESSNAADLVPTDD